MVTTQQGYRSLSAAGLGGDAAVQAALAVLRERTELTVLELGPGRISVSRTRRPAWALAACVATVWLAGLGLLFLLVKRTDSGEVVVANGSRGCVVTVPPLLDAATVEALEAALSAGTPSLAVLAPAAPVPVAAPVAVPVAGGGDLDERTVARGDRPLATDAAGPRLDLRFEAGTVTVAPGVPVVLGRDPSSVDGDLGRPVPGDATTVSKAHLRVAFDGTVATVEDLASTNGSWVVRADGDVPLAPGTPCPVEHGDRVRIGTVELVVEHVAGSAG